MPGGNTGGECMFMLEVLKYIVSFVEGSCIHFINKLLLSVIFHP